MAPQSELSIMNELYVERELVYRNELHTERELGTRNELCAISELCVAIDLIQLPRARELRHVSEFLAMRELLS